MKSYTILTFYIFCFAMHKTWDFKIQWTTTVWSKWQIVIPKSVRDLLDINSGDDLIIITKNDDAMVMMKSEDLEKFMWYLKTCIDEMSNKNCTK